MQDEAGWTPYTAHVRHWPAAYRDQHEAMGFHQGWGQVSDQIVAVARTP